VGATADQGDRVFLAVSSDGRRQPLLSLWPSQVLRHRLGVVLASPRRSVTALLDDVAVTEVLVDDVAVLDVDEPGDLPTPG
jgi:molybdopterin-guanine dinucleotide biosynthesis protein A